MQDLLRNGGVTIYPSITYNDFYFSLNGLNRYLSREFQLIVPGSNGSMVISPSVLMNLESILDMVLSKQNIVYLEKCISSYLQYINHAEFALTRTGGLTDFLKATISFDEYYARFGRAEVELEDARSLLCELLAIAGINLG